MKITKNSPGRSYEKLLLERGLYPGGETPSIPDEPDVVDSGDVVDGFGVGGWRRPRRVVSWILGDPS